MAFQQALSGLTVAGKAIDVTSHNIANASTVGYKQSVSHFSDVYAASLNGSGASQIGIGVNLASVQQQFTQGNISSTNNPLDISINGAGFFRMDNNGAVSFSRNGQFHLDKNGFIVNDQQMKLTGYAAASGIIVPSTPEPLKISASNLSPVATGQNLSSAFRGVKVNVNLGFAFE
jgi:flagellar hook protein FlgE